MKFYSHFLFVYVYMHSCGEGPQLSLSNYPCNLCVIKMSLLHIFLFMIIIRSHVNILTTHVMTFPPYLAPLTSTLFNLNASFLPDYQTAIRKYRHSMALSDSKSCISVVNFSSWRRVSVNTEESSVKSSFFRNHFI